MLGGGGRSKTQEIGQTSDKILHNELTYNKVNDINANKAINTNDYNNIENNNSNNIDKIYKIDYKNRNSNIDTYNNLVTKKNNTFIKTALLVVSWLFVGILSIFVMYSVNLNDKSTNHSNLNNAIAVGTLGVDTNNHTNTYFKNGVGDGTSEQYAFQLIEYEDLTRLADLINSTNADTTISGEITYRTAYYKLMDDIETNTTNWTPIGIDTIYSFNGSFDGQRHTILYNTKTTIRNTYVGVFGYVYGKIQNLSVEWQNGWDCDFSSRFWAGGIAGYVNEIKNCKSYGDIEIIGDMEARIGGIVGSGSTITNCDNFLNLNVEYSGSYAYFFVGGIVGNGSKISNCHNNGTISSKSPSDNFVGGIVGDCGSSVENCYNLGNVVSRVESDESQQVVGGGIVGVAGYYSSKPIKVSGCYNSGLVQASSDGRGVNTFAGGIIGTSIADLNINDCYNIGNIIAETASFSGVGGIVGCSQTAPEIKINNCYNMGAISSNVYGIISGISATPGNSIINCFSIGEAPKVLAGDAMISAIGFDCDIKYGYHNYSSISITTTGTATIYNSNLANLVKQESTFAEGGLTWYDDGTDTYDWNFDSVWGIDTRTTINEADRVNNGYPYLRAIEEYSITYTAGEGTGDEVVEYFGLKVSLPSFQTTLKNISDLNYTAPSEKVFDCWVDESGQPYQSGQEVTLTENLVLIAQWKVNAYTITFDITTNGGSGNAPTEQTVNVGESTTLPTGEYKSGWTFVGWSTDETSTTSNILNGSYTPTSDVTLYAIFSKVLTANFYQLDGANDAETIIIYNNETSGQITAPTISTSGVTGNPQVVGWASSNTSINSSLAQNTSTTISGNVNYYAVVSYTVTISYNGNGHTGGSAVASSTGTAYKTASGNSTPNITKANITIAQNTFTKDNYTFIGWASTQGATSSEYEEDTAYPFDSDKTLYAVWQSNYVGVTFNITTNVGVIFNVYDNLGNFVQQIYVAKGSGQQTITTQLLKGATYTIKMSANYTTNIVSVSGATQQGRALTLLVVESGNTITMQITGFIGGNGIIV